jgi:gas vesicle protein GvpA/GvpJ/GvpM family
MINDVRLRRDSGGHSLVDLLDRVLDKGLVIAGDVKVSVAEVELLTIRIRLLVCSIDKAQAIGLDWWKYDRHLSPERGRALRLGPGSPAAVEGSSAWPVPARARRRRRAKKRR